MFFDNVLLTLKDISEEADAEMRRRAYSMCMEHKIAEGHPVRMYKIPRCCI